MPLKWRYWLFIGLIHLIVGILAFRVLGDQKVWFLVVELILLISLGLAYSIYRSFIKPLDFLNSGIDALADRDFSVRFRKTGSPEMNRLVEVYNRMMDNIRAERSQVQEQHYFLEKLIQASPAGIILLDYDECISDVNPQALRMLGIKQAPYGKKLADTPHPLLQELASWEANQSGVIAGKGQEQFKCEVSQFIHLGFHRKFILFQELSREILAAEKRAYGQVIRMMAHEVNNSIGAINSILQSTQEAFPDLEDAELTDDIRTSLQVAIHRNDRLNRFMRHFAEVVRLPEPIRQRQSVNDLVQRIHQLMTPQAKQQGTQLTIAVPAYDIEADIDEKQLEQALVNMVKNALESLEEEGTVELQLRPNPLEIVVIDNGPGISPEVAKELHTPFFSNKPEGQGVGLTLIREIARAHAAQFSLETLDNGTTEARIMFL